jgi:flagellar motor switch protein FliG
MASLTGQQKAAVVLAQLDPARATKVLKSFSESEVVNLMSAVATLPTLPSEAVQNVITEFSTQATAFAHVGQGGVEVARALLRERLGPARADEILDEYTQATRKQPLEFLNRIDPQQMVGFIGEEHNQTIAVVLAHLHPDHAAAVLSHMDDAQRTDVARRVATLGRISPEVIQHLETVLERKLATVLRIGNATSNEVGGLAGIVAILNNTDRTAEKKILAELEETDPQLAEDIRNEMFVFDDVVSLDDRTLQRVLRNVPPKELAVALKGVLDEVRAKFLRNMSERAAVDLKDEIELLGPTRLSAVDAAQLTVVRAVRELEAAGEIVLARGDDDFV